jgi:hypothetical protein
MLGVCFVQQECPRFSRIKSYDQIIGGDFLDLVLARETEAERCRYQILPIRIRLRAKVICEHRRRERGSVSGCLGNVSVHVLDSQQATIANN